jgi:arylsulfatase A-like enzyme
MSLKRAATLHPRPAGATTADSPAPPLPGVSRDPGVYHPSAALRRILSRQARERARATEAGEPPSTPGAAPAHAPGVLGLMCGAIAVGAASGTLELAVQAFQLQVLHHVDWSTLMISRHASWMVVVVASLLTPCLTVALMTPALLWARLWKRQGVPAERLVWTWDLAGVILMTLFLLGPIQIIPGFHPAAPVALALGAGIQFRRRLVWPSFHWQRAACWSGTIALCVVPGYALLRWHWAASAPERVWSMPGTRASNFLWIVLDTLRADHTSVYGYHRPTTPALDAWSKMGITFEMARSAASWTLPSHVTMFTGLWPSQHEARIDRPYCGPSPTIAEHLRGKGYATAGIAANVRMCNRAYGVGRGFDTYADYPWNDEVSLKAALNSSALGASVLELARRACLPVPGQYPFNLHRPSRAITDEGRNWLEGYRGRNTRAAITSRRPFFLFLNFMDAHAPYVLSPGASRQFWKGPLPPERLAMPGRGWDALRACESGDPLDRPSRRQEFDAVCHRLSDLYDDCVAGMDAELGRFLDGLRDEGMLSNTWVIITSDHGEHFGEHGQFGHGSSLYNEITHVPLILIPPLGPRGPRHDPTPALRGRRINTPVSTRDLARTVAALIEPGAANPFPGGNLAAYWSKDHTNISAPVFAQLIEPRLGGEDFRTENLTRIETLIDEDRVLMETDSRIVELYPLSRDTRQLSNLADDPAEQGRLARLKSKLNAIRSEIDQRTESGPSGVPRTY